MSELDIKRKTVVTTISRQESGNAVTVTAKKPTFLRENVLNSYRSYTYNFTLAALNKTKLKDPTSYRGKDAKFDFVILKTGGKGTRSFNAEAASGMLVTRSNENELGILTTNDIQLGQDAVKDFNANSPGRFDMFIENIEVDALMSFSQQTNTSMATSIRFDVYEPYSINGFIEALNVGATSCGYTSYVGASYILKMEFVGYPDDSDLPDPRKIDYSERYFVIRFTKVEVEVTEKGTRYSCTCLPFHEGAMGTPNKLKDPINMEGTTVKEILTNFINNLNQQIKSNDKEAKASEAAGKNDRYEIKFAQLMPDGSLSYADDENEFSKSKVLEVLRDKAVYRFPDPGNPTQVAPNLQRPATQADVRRADNNIVNRSQEAESKYVRYTPDKPIIQFAEKSNIHECIIAVLRDSQYTKNLLENLNASGTKTPDGMVTYFHIFTEVETDEIDPVSKQNYSKYTYVIAPYKLHYTRIPGYNSQQFRAAKLDGLPVRTYNYIYSGENVDLISFKLNYNHLFFEAFSKNMGSSNYIPSSDALARSGGNKTRLDSEDIRNLQNTDNGVAPTVANPNSYELSNIGTAGPVSFKPYDVMARNMHEAIINSKASLLTADVEILGDPIFLTTSGHGNYKPKLESKGVTKDGEVAYFIQEIFVRINFRNPVDIGENGLMKFQPEKIPFSGVYKVLSVKSTFKEGIFKQQLKLMRIPGQITALDIQETDPADKMETFPDTNDQPVRDISRAVLRPAQARADVNILTQLGKLLATVQGTVSGVTGAIGQVTSGVTGAITQVTSGITGALTDVQSKITQVTSGVSSEIANLSGRLGVTPQQLQNASPTTLLTLAALAKSFPKDVNISAAENQGVSVKNIPAEKVINIPPLAPASKAPEPEVNQTDIQNLLKVGGMLALANAYGVSDSSKISTNSLPKLQSSTLISNTPTSLSNPLSGIVKDRADQKINADRNLTTLRNNSNSVEVSLRLAGSTNTDLEKSVTSVIGSKVESPLSRLINTA